VGVDVRDDMKCKKKDDNPEHHHERLAQRVKKLEARISRLERHQHRTDIGLFTDEPWYTMGARTDDASSNETQ
jgi:hypothetical protein